MKKTKTVPVREERTVAPPALPVENLAKHAHAVKVVLDGEGLRVQFYRRKQPWKLAELMPLVESCGLVALTEETHAPTDARDPIWLHEVLCEVPNPLPGKEALGACMAVLDACMRGDLESDSLNRLSLQAGLGPREIGVWRAWVAYLQQLDARMGGWQMRRIVRARPDLAKAMWEMFAAIHNPVAREGRIPQAAFLESEIAAMPSAEHEKVWRTLLGMVNGCLRTNLWQGGSGEAMAFKFDSAAIPGMVNPKPWREIFVYHPMMEGVHLRGGPVARGGLRHSDRETDYRTEVLGLMTAQMRKNTIIVPVGAKGGFFIRGQLNKASIEAGYRLYVRALLSVSDTYGESGKVVRPKRVVCKDGPDPYMVVAADKGTAKLSDVANDEACKADYWGQKKPGHWMGDAFASGGSKGYDHKQMAITSRGAWISVMHHAGALGILPTKARPLVMVGIGDMGGDVFGNGLLRDPNVALVGAFNHAHIFLDPQPDVAASFAERKRLFAAGLGWDGYDTKKISKGGGVWPRSAKAIELSEAVQARLGLRQKSATPQEVIQAILKAPVDALWNGGIGTYIKASDEHDSAAADKSNDDVRINATDVRVRVIGEGGNLGITPKGRVELGLRGVKLNTDALDNSAGVSTSDHEVNVKILLSAAMREGLIDEAGRLKILRGMTDEIADLVLVDNRLQNLAVTLEGEEDEAYMHELLEWQGMLVKAGVADMQVDCLPTLRDMAVRKDSPYGMRYTRPELCALLAATKAWLRARLLEDKTLLECDAVRPMLGQYFPAILQGKFAAQIGKHQLAKEITATVLANMLVNRLGILAVPRLMADFESGPTDAARACVVACTVARLLPLWNQLDELKVRHETTVEVSKRLKLVAGVIAAWVLRHGQPTDVNGWLKKLHGPCAEILGLLPVVLVGRPELDKWRQEWNEMGLPETFAARMAVLSPLVIAPDVVLASENVKQPLAKVLATHLQVGEQLKLPALVRKIRAMPMPDVWARQAVQAMGQELFLRQRKLTEKILRGGKGVTAWAESDGLERYHSLVREIVREKTLTVAMLSVLIGRLRELES